MIRKYIEKRVAAAIEERGYSDLILAGLEASVVRGRLQRAQDFGAGARVGHVGASPGRRRP